MKLVMLMYLEEDEACVNQVVTELGVPMVTHLCVEGMEAKATGESRGWYGATAPYQSRMTLAVVDDAMSGRLLDAVRDCKGIQDPRHPIRAVQLAVEGAAACACESPEWR
jgi:hypothetical protein